MLLRHKITSTLRSMRSQLYHIYTRIAALMEQLCDTDGLLLDREPFNLLFMLLFQPPVCNHLQQICTAEHPRFHNAGFPLNTVIVYYLNRKCNTIETRLLQQPQLASSNKLAVPFFGKCVLAFFYFCLYWLHRKQCK